MAAIAGVVAAALATGYGMSRALGLPPRMSVLVACGNSICGNSAIAAVAPVIGAHADDIASAIAFTAILGVVVVLSLPLLVPVLGLSHYAYGVLAGMTVYAVPQVLAATAPIRALSVQVGTLVKLVRVLMLGPVVLGLSLVVGRINRPDRAENWDATVAGRRRPSPGKLIPWFIVGFIVLAALRSSRADTGRTARADRDGGNAADCDIDGGARARRRRPRARPGRLARHGRGHRLACCCCSRSASPRSGCSAWRKS